MYQNSSPDPFFEISDFAVTAADSSNFVQPVKLSYSQNGRARSWEAVRCHDGVSVLLYHTQQKAFLLVKQFRAPVHMHHPVHTCTYELCAGIVDKQLPLKQIVSEEIYEECGYEVPLDNIRKVSSFFPNVGITGNRQHLFFATIDASMHRHAGGGIHNEQIMLTYLPLGEAKTFLFDEALAKTPGLMFSFYWFFECYGALGQKFPVGDRPH